MLELSAAGQKVFDARYALRDEGGNVIETFEQAVWRLACVAAGAEKENRQQWEEIFAGLIGGLLFIPSTPVWANMGKADLPWQPSACFVLAVEDSLQSMYETLAATALVFKSGGGVGYNFSSIRPKGSLVHSTKGRASGVVELIKLYNASSDMVMQGGVRRGASMGILNVDHPEIFDFVNAKRTGQLTNFNLSVGITDEFMAAVENELEWPLLFNGQVHEVVPAAKLWAQIVDAAHACGDPGIIFMDAIQKNNPVPKNLLNCTNPCVTGETWVLTVEGPRMVKELLGSQFNAVINGKSYKTGEKGFFKTATKTVVCLNTFEGYCLRLTADHKVLRVTNKDRYVLKSEWIPVSGLAPGDKIVLHNHRPFKKWPGSLTEGEGYLLGLLVGDGVLMNDSAVLSVWHKESAVNDTGLNGSFSVMKAALGFAMELPHRSDFTGWSLIKGRNEYRLKSGYLRHLATRMGLRPGNKTITPEIEKASSDGYAGFLRGFFDADGTVGGDQNKGVSIRLPQSNLAVLHAVQRMLLRFGIASTVYQNRRPAGVKLLPDGKGGLKEYSVKMQHELVISNDNILVFAECISFGDCEKNQKLNRLIRGYRRKVNRERFLATVSSVIEDGTEEVYDVQVQDVNAFDANGIIAHNCGEQILSPGESCLLGSVNLARMVRDNGRINQELLKETVAVAVRFLDNLIDVAEYPLPAITEATRATRKIGLGFTGIADALVLAGLAYDSEEGRLYAGEITSLIQETAIQASRELASEKGCFPDWESSIFYPAEKRRNAACVTIAPTGSVTTMAGCEGYGVEPLFAVAYRKATNVAGDFEVFSPLFLAACQKYGVAESILSEVAERGTCQGVVGIPAEIARIFKGAQEISAEDHLLMQAAVQKYVCNAVSKTVNLHNTATVEEIAQCYKLAHRLGLKGVTVFRDGCKEGTVTVGKKERPAGVSALRHGEVLPRPKSASGVTHRLDTGCGKLYLTINYQADSGEIMETFITTGSDGGCLVYTEATSRLVSLAIRAGVSIEEIAGQLQSTHSCPSYLLARGKGKNISPGKSCASAIAHEILQTMGKLNGSGQKKATDCSLLCECGEQLERAEGCLVCRSCGYAKC
ncbi:MAG: ribonucleoside reductase class II [Dethiobacter sp.]|nr:ribonucleoside reductase class II [Dethiobacter sp.]MBS3900389.1 ribonucleoside reductase class II [Dethiobacter sp.]MBS3983293.1 ribonucleoside reductase class II [Dethiobacter sp.]MCL4464297.1 ribonucleoside reductase class II [Bacillota bacterium]